MVKQHKDKLFILAMLVVLGNILYWGFYRLMALISGFNTFTLGGKITTILIVLSSAIAIWGIIYLIRVNHLRRKLNKQNNQ